MNPIVTLVDYSDVAPALIEQTERLAKALGLPVILVHVISQDPMAVVGETVSQIPSEEEREELIAKDHRRLSGLADRLRAAGVDVEVRQLTDADIGKALVECGHWNAGFIVVGSHHHGALYNWFVGSVTSDVLRTANCPVLVVPPTPVPTNPVPQEKLHALSR